MKLKDYLIEQKQIIKNEKLPSVIEMDEISFQKLYTWRERGNYSAFELINKCKETILQIILGGKLATGKILIDTSKLRIHDAHKNTFRKPANDSELLEAELPDLVSGGSIAKINIENGHPDFTPSCAIKQTQLSEDIAWGMNVRVCTNFSILQADSLLKTANKVSVTDMLSWLKQKVTITEQRFEADIQMVETLKQKQVARSHFDAYLGRELRRIEKSNYHRLNRTIGQLNKQEKELVFTGRELGRLALESTMPSHLEWEWTNDHANRWQILNWATEILKLNNGSDINTLLRTNERFTQQLLTYDFELQC